ncbi:LYR motif-containing protein 4B [Nasonia vitripennis]|uniref:Complex 1 LYR protein domain-containing protein n=1 Tax=Nasonia vitripennis TaxID=7425 RepID=A0A7M7QR07_NASVI|nr:LYR motif-containing protein 4B [Nasonia vitripennis]
MACSRTAILELYRNLIKESKKWCSYNYREYALRKIRYEFQQNKSLQDPAKIDDCYKRGLESLDVLRRQVTIGNLYKTDKLVIEVNQK